jgi:hypothetical protein
MPNQGSTWLPARACTRWTSSCLRRGVDLRTYRHDVELSSLVTELEREFGPERVVSEREIRAIDTPGLRQEPDYRPRFGVLVGGVGPAPLTPAGHPRVHYPDVAVVGANSVGTLAIELERTLKGRTRLRSILRSYVSARHLKRVRYYATRPETARQLEEETARLRAESLIEVWLCSAEEFKATQAPDTAA